MAAKQTLLDRLSAQCPALLYGNDRQAFGKGSNAEKGKFCGHGMIGAQRSGVDPLARFAEDLQKDFSAVLPAT